METPILTQWISWQMMNAICWTLIHSLWIGLLVALLAGGVIIGTQKSSSQLRYQLLCGCLLLFVGLTGSVFYQEITGFQSSQTDSIRLLPDVPSLSPILGQGGGALTRASDMSIVNSLTSLINQHTGWIFVVWLLFFAFKSLTLIGGLYYVRQIRYRKVHAPGHEWQHKVLAFSQALSIQQSVSLLQSELVKVPVTVGLLKPVILVPMGLLFQLPPEQIETILWHELAHIGRRDYLVNLLQSLVETIFFFNPALLWLSSQIRDERETCCDDIVLAHTDSKSNYLEALLAFQACSDQSAAYSVALGFGSHQLVNRLKRMVTQENKRLSTAEKIALLSGLLLLSASSFMSQPTPATATNHRKLSLPKQTIIQTIARPAPVPIRDNDKAEQVVVTLKAKSSQVEPMPVFRTIPAASEDTARTFTSIVFVHTNQDMANREMMVRDDKDNRYRLKIVANELLVLEVNGVVIPEQDRDNYKELLPQIDRVLTEKRQVKHEAITKAKASHLDQETNKAVAGTTEKKWPAGFIKKKGILVRDTSYAVQTRGKKNLPLLPDISHDQARVRGVIDALVEEKIVSDPASVDWFGLSDDELIVNGKKQPAELHQKLKANYGVKPQYGLYYGPVKMSGRGIFLDKEEL